MNGLFGGGNCGCGQKMECCDIVLLLLILNMCGCGCNFDCCWLILILLLCGGGFGGGCDRGCHN